MKNEELTFSDAIGKAIHFEMERNEKVLILGEDIAAYGGVFGATSGLVQRFGEKRVRDTPISEMAFTGMGVGLAMAGYRPIIEIMFVDFIGSCLDQVYNSMAKIPYMSGGNTRIPMVIKTAAGCIGAAAQHSQCLWGTFAHLPGMKVVVPSCPYTAKGLMAAALRSDDPVIFIEHKALMRRKLKDFDCVEEVQDDDYELPIGKAHIVLTGDDLTIVTLAKGVQDSIAAARILQKDGINAEIIDLRSVVPLDIKTIENSVTKTGNLLIVDEDYLSFGLSGEIIARLLENLGAQGIPNVRRLATPDVPIPAAKSLESEILFSKEDIVFEAKKLLET
jgi:acetoin:2,6-dichlorophenolindophenol oxidoreductase subunit beta